MYIELRQGDGHVGDELEQGIVADYDTEGHVLGMEVLHSRRRLGGSIPKTLDVELLVNERPLPGCAQRGCLTLFRRASSAGGGLMTGCAGSSACLLHSSG
jgi:uncharacterized protein YuzE